ncbi:hypothetical protein THIOM_001838 [Candidatus Thiomargarita nelsonii]|uniref:Uncharacterized protein n=1 Tax=Candidatus Thiomargarita nelsonii TaxID=1003181 RepID=A0A176S2N5_9GAMM|nr:hypothetical protein THIOM_001838 [Candidatus Thiomargarita nelsonii]
MLNVLPTNVWWGIETVQPLIAIAQRGSATCYAPVSSVMNDHLSQKNCYKYLLFLAVKPFAKLEQCVVPSQIVA